MKSSSLLPVLAATFALGAVHTRAAILASYQFDGPSETNLSIDTHPDAIATPFGAGSGTNSGSLRYSTAQFSSGNRSVLMTLNDLTGSQQGALDGADYWTFTVTAAPGTFLNLDQLTFRYGSSGPNQVASSSIFIRSSADEYQSNLFYDTEQDTLTFPGTATFTNDTVVIPLAGLASHQNLTEITFQIYGYYTPGPNPGGGGAAGVRLDDIQLTGSVIPEPSTTLLSTAFLASALLRRKRTP